MNNYQTIDCGTFDRFMRIIIELVQRQIGFKADADSLSITLTGGF
jgi:hypothetical protein